MVNFEQESFPFEIIEKLFLGEGSKVKVIREYRGYTLTVLASRVGISEAYLSKIENHKRKGNIDFV